jgi:hypothetical protein
LCSRGIFLCPVWGTFLFVPRSGFVPRAGHHFVTPGHVFVHRLGHRFLTPGKVYVPQSEHLLVPRAGTKPGHLIVRRKGDPLEFLKKMIMLIL